MIRQLVRRFICRESCGARKAFAEQIAGLTRGAAGEIVAGVDDPPDPLDSETVMFGDERHDHRRVWSSSEAKYANCSSAWDSYRVADDKQAGLDQLRLTIHSVIDRLRASRNRDKVDFDDPTMPDELRGG